MRKFRSKKLLGVITKRINIKTNKGMNKMSLYPQYQDKIEITKFLSIHINQTTLGTKISKFNRLYSKVKKTIKWTKLSRNR